MLGMEGYGPPKTLNYISLNKKSQLINTSTQPYFRMARHIQHPIRLIIKFSYVYELNVFIYI